MRKVLLQAGFLVNIALGLALGFHFLAHSGFPLLGLAAPSTLTAFPDVSVDEVWRHSQNQSAAIVDARTSELYSYGHLPGSLSAPNDLEIPPSVLGRLKSAPLVIVYCDGPKCQGSHLLASKLKGLGLPNLQIMRQGWEGWLDSGLPVEFENPEG
jgi:rhodanese-related sulfurtransferase